MVFGVASTSTGEVFTSISSSRTPNMDPVTLGLDELLPWWVYLPQEPLLMIVFDCLGNGEHHLAFLTSIQGP